MCKYPSLRKSERSSRGLCVTEGCSARQSPRGASIAVGPTLCHRERWSLWSLGKSSGGLSACRKPLGNARGAESSLTQGASVSQGTKRDRIQHKCMRGIFFSRCLNKGQLLLWASCEIKCHSLVYLCTWS